MPLTVPNHAEAAHSEPSLPNCTDLPLLQHAIRRAAPRPVEAPLALRYWHLLSLDAPTVAVVWSLAFAWAAHVRLPLWLLILQILVVWAVYVGDRLLDARSSLRNRDGEDMRERHFFHWRHRALLAPLAIAAACAAAWVALHWMPFAAEERDSLLGVASLAYFTRVHSSNTHAGLRRFSSKEFLVGSLFTAGCALPAWSRTTGSLFLIPVLFFAALAWLNCRSIEEWEADIAAAPIAPRALTIAAAGACAALFLLHAAPRSAALLATGAASALLLALLDRNRHRVSAVLLRAAADLVLLTPIALLALSGARW